MRKAMVEPNHPQLSVRKQAELLKVNRNRLDSPPDKADASDLEIMDQMDKLHTKDPTLGSRRMKNQLWREHGVRVGRGRVRRLMRLMGLRAIYCRPRTSIPGKGHKIYPYLLRNVAVTRPNQAWCADITYIPLPRGFCYVVAIMDWYSRKVLSWEVSTTMDTDFCVSAYRGAVEETGCTPEIMNTDQGSQFTSKAWIEAVTSGADTQVSMDGRGRWMDNVFIERLWRSMKYEDVYLRSYASPREVAQGLRRWFRRYNDDRCHSSLEDCTPSEWYAGTHPEPLAA